MGSISFAVGYNCLRRNQYYSRQGVNTVFAIGAKIVTDQHQSRVFDRPRVLGKT